MKIAEIRRERLRQLIEKHGVSNLATMLGYRQASYLSQMAGPNPSRNISEKTVRNFEAKLDLPSGALDEPVLREEEKTVEVVQQPTDTALVADVIRMVGNICATEKVELSPMKFADVVALAYLDAVEHNRTPRPDHIMQIVRLLK